MRVDNDHRPLRPERDFRTLWLVLVILLSVGVFAPSLINGFTYDDPHYARTTTPTGDANPMVAELQPFADYWRKPMNWGLPTNCRGFRPMTVYSFAVINHWFASGTGDDAAWIHHLLNLVLHGLATLLVVLLVRRLAGDLPGILAGAVFGVHALHSGPVAAIVGRAELMAFAFGAGSMLLYTHSFTSRRSTRKYLLVIAGVLLLMGFGSKESAVAWAVFTPLYAAARGIRFRIQTWPLITAIGIPVLAFLLMRHHMMVNFLATKGPFWVEYDANPLYYLPAVQRVATAVPIMAYGLGTVALPINLSSNYGDGVFTAVDSLLNWRFLGSALALLGIVFGGLRIRNSQPLLFLAVAAFFGFGFVTSNIPFPIETIFGDRLFYTPVLALSLAVAWIARYSPRRAWPVLICVLAPWLGWNSVLSVQRSIAWKDNTTLTTADLLSQPNSVGLHIEMGNLRLWNFDAARGHAEFEAALRINPQSPRALRFLAENSPDEAAEPLLRRALSSPYLVEGTEGRRIHWALANLHEKAGRPDDARQEAEKALASNPYVADIRIHLLREALRAGEMERFAKLLADGVALVPDDPYFAIYGGVLLHRRGEYRDAAEVLGRELPGRREQLLVVESWLVLADSLLRTGHIGQAREIATRYRLLVGKYPEALRECDRILGATGPSKPIR